MMNFFCHKLDLDQGVRMQKPIQTIVSATISLLLASSAVNAGGFSLYTEGSTVATGNFAAGIAAEAADASTGWYNPAGLALINDQQVVMSGVGVFPSSELSGTSTFRTRGLPSYSQTFSDLQGGVDAFVPAFHYAHPIGESAAFGFSMVSPFGLSTDYDRTSPVRYAATFSELLTINMSPEIGGKLTENLSLGLGIDLQWARVKFNRMLGAPTVSQLGGGQPTALDSQSYNKGHSFGVGFHAGVLGMFNDNHTRVGLNYQSKMKHTFHGYSELSGPLADDDFNPRARFRNDNLYSNNIELPDIVTLSAYQDVNNKLAILGSVVYTGWDVFKRIQLNNAAVFSSEVGQVTVNTNSSQNYHNAWRFALGANYHLDDAWMLRAGAGYDETPTVDAEREVRLPDADRWALSVGAHYQMRPDIGFDAGYTYLFAAKDPIVNKTEALGTTSSYNVNARTDVHAHLVGLQVVWTIDKEKVATTK